MSAVCLQKQRRAFCSGQPRCPAENTVGNQVEAGHQQQERISSHPSVSRMPFPSRVWKDTERGQAEVRTGVKGGELLGNWGSGKTAPEALLLIPNPQHQALRKQSWELVRSAQNTDSRKLLQVVLDTALLSRLLFPNRLWGVIKSFGRTS